MRGDRLSTVLKVYTVLVAGGFVAFVKADPDLTLECPPVFTYGTSNPIIFRINSTWVANAGCFTAAAVVFEVIRHGEDPFQLCSKVYPPDSCNDFTTSRSCGCVKKEGAEYTYKFLFLADRSHLGGQITARVCTEPKIPLEEKVSPFCKPIRFPDAVKTHCPRFFTPGQNDVTCTINSSLVTWECNGSIASTVQFGLTVNGTESPACSPYPSYIKSECTTGDGATCGCRSMSGDTRTYFLNFTANESVHDGGSLRCKIGCLAGSPGPSIGPACPIAFEPKSSSGNFGLIIGVTTGGVVVVAVAIGTAVYCNKKRSSGGHDVHSNNIRFPPAVGRAGPSADRDLATTSDVAPKDEDATESDFEGASDEASGTSEPSEEP